MYEEEKQNREMPENGSLSEEDNSAMVINTNSKSINRHAKGLRTSEMNDVIMPNLSGINNQDQGLFNGDMSGLDPNFQNSPRVPTITIHNQNNGQGNNDSLMMTGV